MTKIQLSRQQRIYMTLHDYYFGANGSTALYRIVMGPVLAYIGVSIYLHKIDRFAIAYGGLCIAYGVYYTFKPLLWFITMWKSYAETEFEIDITPENLVLKDKQITSVCDYSAFKITNKSKKFYLLRLENRQSVHLPMDQLSEEYKRILDDKLAN